MGGVGRVQHVTVLRGIGPAGTLVCLGAAVEPVSVGGGDHRVADLREQFVDRGVPVVQGAAEGGVLGEPDDAGPEHRRGPTVDPDRLGEVAPVEAVEVSGIGGRQDATNVIAPELSVITNVEYDHTEMLGETLEQIAAEKAGIIKPFTPVLCGPMPDGPRAVIVSRAEALKAPVLLSGQDYDVREFVRTGYTGICTLEVGPVTYSQIRLTSPAAFMATNASHALMAYDVLRRRAVLPAIDAGAIGRAFEGMELPACCEVLSGTPTVLLDSAHNAPAAVRLAGVLRTTFEGRRTVLLVSLAQDAQWEQVLRALAGSGADRLIVTCVPRDRAVPPHLIAEQWRSCSAVAAEVVESADAAFRRSLQAAGPHGVLVVTGSPQLAGYCRPLAKACAAEALVRL